MKKLDEKSKNLLKVSLISIIVFFGFWYIGSVQAAFSFFLAVIQPMVVGLMVAYVINLPMSFYEEKIFGKFNNEKMRKLSSPLSLILAWITIILVTLILLNVLIPRIISSFTSLAEKWPSFVKELKIFLNSHELTKKYAQDLTNAISTIDIDSILQSLETYLEEDGFKLLDKTSNLLNNVSSTIVTIFTAVILSFFILLNKKQVQKNANKFLYAFVDESKADYIYKIFSLAYETFEVYIKSKILSGTILGLLIFIGMLLLRIPYAPMVSVMVGVFDFIPIIGPIIGGGISMILIFIESPIKSLVFLAYVLIIQQVQGSIIYPALAGKQIGLPSLWILIAITIGGALFGFLGMLVAIPVVSILYTLINEKIDKELEKKEITDEDIDKKIEENKFIRK